LRRAEVAMQSERQLKRAEVWPGKNFARHWFQQHRASHATLRAQHGAMLHGCGLALLRAATALAPAPTCSSAVPPYPAQVGEFAHLPLKSGGIRMGHCQPSFFD
jgi:hypothetical protein